MAHHVYHTSLGFIRIEHCAQRLTSLKILEHPPVDFGTPDSFTDSVFAQVTEYLNGERTVFDVEIDLSCCTPFQQLVYRELLQIPYGQTCSYSQVAEAVGNPKAARAVGLAANRNPVHIIVPCHRVVGKQGLLVGYAAGLSVKAMLLKVEMRLMING
ncbi:MAG: methylated-DNA--[protein]-cysteine S-methyltransferase [Rikenellaceae bacterium]